MPLTAGTRLGPYEILRPIGAGGMGEVYRARHLKLARDVAVKVLPADLADDPERLARFEREARTASALNHPNIVTIHDIAEHEGTTFIAMELVEGRTLRELIADGPLPVARVLDVASQIADGLARAHAAGVVHRDVKPANVMITDDGLVKILDFGLAKAFSGPDGRAPSGTTLTRETRKGTILGTPHYMSPEQLSGEPVDHRSDQFSFGVVLYEMVSGEPPFDGPSVGAVISAVLARPPAPLTKVRAGTPAALGRVIDRCLEKEPSDRFATLEEVGTALTEVGERRPRSERSLAATLRRPMVRATGAAVLGAVVLAAWLWSLGADERWAENEALAEITGHIETGDLFRAYRTTLRAERYRPEDPELERVFERITLPVTVRTGPPGARVSLRGYGRPEAAWVNVGETPLDLRIPYALMQWRITREGYESFVGAPFSGNALAALGGLALDSVGTWPEGMVRVPGGPPGYLPLEDPPGAGPVQAVGDFFLDRYEVTNREFAEFVDAGGYRSPEWWPGSMEHDGREVTWEEAVDAFRDATGRHGPSTWELGDHPAGRADHPVGGISWFEAAAYCAWAGRSLPTIYHWTRAVGQEQLSDIVVQSNMDGEDKAPVGEFQGLAAYGTWDMAGNVKEWVWNATGDRRYILGGSWNEPTYMFRRLDAQDPWGREPTYGVRCARYPDAPDQRLRAPVSRRHEYPRPDPLDDEAFGLLRELYAYDRDSLDARVERVNDSLPGHRREVVSIRTAYGNERMEVNLLLPRDVAPPYQSVLWFPGDDVFALRSSESFSSSWLFDFLPRAGRAVVYPIYRGMYERFEPWQRTPNDWRDMVISWAQDIGRTIDYLETRPDFDATRIAYYGFSAGALYAPVFTAVEPRISVSMFIGGGLPPKPPPTAMHPAHFAPRSRVPTLMINGENDFLVPYEVAQRPFFEMLGTPDRAKRHARLAGGHIPSEPREIMREVLDWLDLHFGPVGTPVMAEGGGSASGAGGLRP